MVKQISPELEKLGYSWEKLVRQIANHPPRAGIYRRKGPRWAVMSQIFATGSTVGALICKEFGLDPEEII